MPIKQRFDNYERKTTRTKRKFLMPCYTKVDIYRHYKKDIPHKAKTPYNINKKTFDDVLDLYNVSLVEIIKEGITVGLPHKMGGIQLVKVRCKVRPDIEYKKDVTMFQNHFFLPVTHWVKYRNNCKARIKNIKMYCFSLPRSIKDELRKSIDNNGLGNLLFTVRP